MVCEPDETDLDIHIPSIILPQDAGASLKKMLLTNSSVSVQLYSPKRPLVDIAEVFLWLMTVDTILCASYWSAWTAREAGVEQDKPLKDAIDEVPNDKVVGASSVVEMNTASAVLFVVIASCFLVILYELMSYWFIELLVVLFCIGGVEGLQTCLVALLSRYDWLANKSLCAGYFPWAMFAYGLGLLITYVALNGRPWATNTALCCPIDPWNFSDVGEEKRGSQSLMDTRRTRKTMPPCPSPT